MTKSDRIVLLHATPVAMAPVMEAFAKTWPEAETINLLDDSLSIDRAGQDGLSDDLANRFVAFGHYAYSIGAGGILATCSAFGPPLDRLAAELPVPVLKPNEAMFRAAIARGNRIGMLATFASAVATMRDEFDAFVAQAGSAATLDVIVVEDAIERLRQGDAATHNRLVSAQASRFAGHDAIMLAHFSTARAADLVQAAVDVPVLAAPESAVLRMKQLIEGKER
jgi:aspartate/glutamate racemase